MTGANTEIYCLMMDVEIGSKSHCLIGLVISYGSVGRNWRKDGGVVEGTD